MKNEVWKDIKNYEKMYQVSNHGRVKSFKSKKEKILVPYTNKKGYKVVSLSKNGKSEHFLIHKLVLNTFQPLMRTEQVKRLPNELDIDINKVQVNHIDKNPSNNIISNLEYCTNNYNIKYSQCVKISQYTLDGVFVKCWEGINIAKRETKTNNIEKCLCGERNKAGNYIWKYDK